MRKGECRWESGAEIGRGEIDRERGGEMEGKRGDRSRKRSRDRWWDGGARYEREGSH